MPLVNCELVKRVIPPCNGRSVSMFALQPSVGVFEDELQEYKVARGVTSKSLDDSKAKQSSSAGASSSAAQLSKPKRKCALVCLLVVITQPVPEKLPDRCANTITSDESVSRP